MGWPEGLATGATTASAVAAAWAAWQARRAAETTASLLKIEQARWERDQATATLANLKTIVRAHPTMTYRLSVINDGPAAAEDFDFEIMDETGRSLPGTGDLSRPVLSPGQLVATDAIPASLADSDVTVRLRWTDGAGPHEEDRLVQVKDDKRSR